MSSPQVRMVGFGGDSSASDTQVACGSAKHAVAGHFANQDSAGGSASDFEKQGLACGLSKQNQRLEGGHGGCGLIKSAEAADHAGSTDKDSAMKAWVRTDTGTGAHMDTGAWSEEGTGTGSSGIRETTSATPTLSLKSLQRLAPESQGTDCLGSQGGLRDARQP